MTKATGASTNRDPLVEEFLRYLADERNASPRTLKAYRQALTVFGADKKTSWKKCRPDDFRDYLFALMKREQARSILSVANVLSVSHRSKTAGTESGSRSAVAEN